VLTHLGREFLAEESQVSHERADDGAVIEI
jgi:hypothetical protein